MIGETVEYEVWQGEDWQASATTLDDALHYLAVYSQDGPCVIVKATTVREYVVSTA